MSENIFDAPVEAPEVPPTSPTPPATTPPADDFGSLLGAIVNEEGVPKYKDVPTALDALKHSQEYIKTLKAQLEEATNKASEAASLADVIAALKDDKPVAPAAPVAPQGLTQEDVLRLLEQKEAAKIAKGNISVVAVKMKEKFGDKAEAAFYGRGKELGLSAEQLNGLAASSPNAVFTMFGLSAEASAAPPTPNGVNTTGTPPTTPAPRTPVMGYKSDKDVLGYWKTLNEEIVNKYKGA